MVRKELDAAGQKRYSTSNGKPYYPNRTAARNAGVKDYVDSKMPALVRSLPSSFTPSNTTSLSYNPYERYSAFGNRPMQEFFFNAYAKALGDAETQALVTGYVNRFP